MTPVLELRPRESCRYDVVTLGEVMLRLDPGEGRIRTARSFTVSEGGGEYNVGRALRRVFGHRVATVTAIGESEIGRLLEDLLLQGGTNLDHVVWKQGDPVGREHRTPLNFTERGFGVRAPVGVSDRAHSAASALRPDDVDWDRLFGELGARWLHTGGIVAGLSESTRDTVRAAIDAAVRHGTRVSYDVNYRPSLWHDRGGADAHRRLTDEFARSVDVLVGVDATTMHDWFLHERIAPDSTGSPAGATGPSIVATTHRVVHSASIHDWGGMACARAGDTVQGTTYERLAVLDRVGSGDAFTAGLIHGLLEGRSLAESLEYGIAHGALVMTTPGDTSSVGVEDVDRVITDGPSAITR